MNNTFDSSGLSLDELNDVFAGKSPAIASVGATMDAKDYKGSPSRGATETAALNQQAETGTTAYSDIDNAVARGAATFSANTGLAKTVDRFMANNAQELAQGIRKTFGGTIDLARPDVDESHIDYMVDAMGANGWGGLLKKSIGAWASGAKALRGKDNLIDEWERTEGYKYDDPYQHKMAKLEWAKELASGIVGQREEAKINAKAELDGRDSSWMADIGTDVIEQGGYTFGYIAGALLPGGKLTTYGVPLALATMQRASDLEGDKLAVGEDGKVRVDKAGDSMGAAFKKGAIGAAGEVAIEEIGGAITAKGAKALLGKTIGRIPVFKKVGGKLMQTKVGRSLDKYWRTMTNLGHMTGVQSFPEEYIEEAEQSLLDAALGVTRRDSELEGTTAMGRISEDMGEFFSADDQKKLVRSLLVMQVLQGGGAKIKDVYDSKYATFAKETKTKEKADVFVKDKEGHEKYVEFVRGIDGLLRDEAGVDEKELKYYTFQEKADALEAWVNGLSEVKAKGFLDDSAEYANRVLKMMNGNGRYDVSKADADLAAKDKVTLEKDFSAPQQAKDDIGRDVMRRVARIGNYTLTMDMWKDPSGTAGYSIKDNYNRTLSASDANEAATKANEMLAEAKDNNAKLEAINTMRTRVGRNVLVITGPTFASMKDRARQVADKRGWSADELASVIGAINQGTANSQGDNRGEAFSMTIKGQPYIFVPTSSINNMDDVSRLFVHEGAMHGGFQALFSGEEGEKNKAEFVKLMKGSDMIRAGIAEQAEPGEYRKGDKLVQGNASEVGPTVPGTERDIDFERAADEATAYSQERNFAGASPMDKATKFLRDTWRKSFKYELPLNERELRVYAEEMRKAFDKAGSDGKTYVGYDGKYEQSAQAAQQKAIDKIKRREYAVGLMEGMRDKSGQLALPYKLRSREWAAQKVIVPQPTAEQLQGAMQRNFQESWKRDPGALLAALNEGGKNGEAILAEMRDSVRVTDNKVQEQTKKIETNAKDGELQKFKDLNAWMGEMFQSKDGTDVAMVGSKVRSQLWDRYEELKKNGFELDSWETGDGGTRTVTFKDKDGKTEIARITPTGMSMNFGADKQAEKENAKKVPLAKIRSEYKRIVTEMVDAISNGNKEVAAKTGEEIRELAKSAVANGVSFASDKTLQKILDDVVASGRLGNRAEVLKKRILALSDWVDEQNLANNVNAPRWSKSRPRGEQKRYGVEYPSATREELDAVIKSMPGVRWSMGKKAREAAVNLIVKKRPDLWRDVPFVSAMKFASGTDRIHVYDNEEIVTRGAAEEAVDEIGKFSTSKEQKAALHWFIKGAIRLPEDAPKVTEAIKYGERAKGKANTDPMSYDSPMAMIDALHEFKPKAKPIDPDTVPQLSDKRDMGNGVVTYLVQDDREGQRAMRQIINTHWGEDANPWCLLQGDGHGNLSDGSNGAYDAWYYWNHYNALPKRVAFKNGKLLAFMATDGEGRNEIHSRDWEEFFDPFYDEWNESDWEGTARSWMEEYHPNELAEFDADEQSRIPEQWWDRKDASHEGIPLGNMPVPNDKFGRWADFEIRDGKLERIGRYQKGNVEDVGHMEWNDEGIKTSERRNDGWYEWDDYGNLKRFNKDKNEYNYDGGKLRSVGIDVNGKTNFADSFVDFDDDGNPLSFENDIGHWYFGVDNKLDIPADENPEEFQQTANKILSLVPEAERIYRENSQNPVRWSIIGKRGADRIGLGGRDEAIQMEKDGKSREEIWRTTGWWKGPDDRWRVEVDVDLDSAREFMDYIRKNAGKKKAVTLNEAMPHMSPSAQADWRMISEAYPYMGNFKFRRYAKSGEGGHASGSEVVISPSWDTKWKEDNQGYGAELALLHEVQHKIQDWEGLGRGSDFTRTNMPKNPVARAAAKEAISLVNADAANKPRFWKWYLDAWIGMDGSTQTEYREDNKRTQTTSVQPVDKSDYEWDNFIDDRNRLTAAFDKLEGIAQKYGYNDRAEMLDAIIRELNAATYYYATTGEAESRLVEVRAMHSAKWRWNTPPWKNFDVWEADQITRGANSEPKSLPGMKASVNKTIAKEMISSATRWSKKGGKDTIVFMGRKLDRRLAKEMSERDKLRGKDEAWKANYAKLEKEVWKSLKDYGDVMAFIPDETASFMKYNSSYPQASIDFVDICIKREMQLRVLTDILRKHPDFEFDKVDLEIIAEELKKTDPKIRDMIQTACTACFVEHKRQELSKVCRQFIDAMRGNYDESLNGNQREFMDALREHMGKKLEKIGKATTIFDLAVPDGSAPYNAKHRIDFTYYTGANKDIPHHYSSIYECFVKFNDCRGQQRQQLFDLPTEYRGELKMGNRVPYGSKGDTRVINEDYVRNVNELGGLRFWSKSDFDAKFLGSIIEILKDANALGLHAQSYTKRDDFAWLMRNTNVKILRSGEPLGKGYSECRKSDAYAVPIVRDGKTKYYRLDFDPVEGVAIDSPDVFDSSSHPDIGVNVMGIGMLQMEIAQQDPRVAQIIPMHGDMTPGMRKMADEFGWIMPGQDAEWTVNEKGRPKMAGHINFYSEVITPMLNEGKKITEKSFVERFLKVCKDKGWNPRCPYGLKKVGDWYAYKPGYSKYLADGKFFEYRTDAEVPFGTFYPQETVKPDIDPKEAKLVIANRAKEIRERNALPLGGTAKSAEERMVARTDRGKKVRWSKFRVGGNYKGEFDEVIEAPNRESVYRIYGDLTKRRDGVDKSAGIYVIMSIDDSKKDTSEGAKPLPGMRTAAGDSVVRKGIGAVGTDADAAGNGNGRAVLGDGQGSGETLDAEESFTELVNSGYPNEVADRLVRNGYRAPIWSKRSLVTPEEDVAYADAVKRGDKETALKMIRDAAAKAMPNVIKDKHGLPLVVYHGSNRFGETVFDKKLMMFTTDSKSRASGYGGPGFGSSRGFSRERSVEKFEPFDFENTDTVIRKANSVLGYNLHKATSDDLEKSFDELKKELSGFNDRVNSLQGFPDELTEEQLDFSNRIQSIAYAFGMEESEWKSLKDKIIDGSVKDYYLYNYLNREVRDIYDRYASLRNEYYDKMRNEMSEKGRKYLDEFFKGYDNADALIDAQYSFYNLLNPSNDIAREDGNIINRKLLVDEIINSYQSGIYSMFIDSGERQLVIDAKGAFWDNIEFNSKKMSTDSIGKWAKDNGYTSVRIDNVMDPGVQNAEGNDFITFSPSQVKSADITYDDNGNLIPLSERFNQENPDIRWSMIIGEKGAARLDDSLQTVANLNVAREMLGSRAWKDLVHDEKIKIRMATGWEMGADGKWKFEIGNFRNAFEESAEFSDYRESADALRSLDNELSVMYRNWNPDTAKKAAPMIERQKRMFGRFKKEFYGSYVKLGEFIDGTEVATAYPELSEFPVVFENVDGYVGMLFEDHIAIDPIGADNGMRDYKDMFRTLIHEVQHKIQTLEGFSLGSTVEESGNRKYRRAAGEVEARNAERRGPRSMKRLLEDTEDVARDSQRVFFDANQQIGKIEEVRWSKSDRATRLAPNGSPSNLTDRQYEMVRTPEFKAWFGDWENDPENASKVVDENGEPRVMFHGSDDIRTEFKMLPGMGGDGAYFTSAFPEAADYVREKLGDPELSEDECDGYITECFLNVRDDASFYNSKYGFGEVIVKASDPTQIKSATDNSGAFDANNPDIRFSKSKFRVNPFAQQMADFLKDPSDAIEHANSRASRMERNAIAKWMNRYGNKNPTEAGFSTSVGLASTLSPKAIKEVFSDKAGMKAFFTRFREKVQDADLILKRLDELLGVTDKERSAYYQRDRNYGMIEKYKDEFDRELYQPLVEAVAKLRKEYGDNAYDELKYVLLALHGKERNRMIAERGATVKKLLGSDRMPIAIKDAIWAYINGTADSFQTVLTQMAEMSDVFTAQDRANLERELKGSGASTAAWEAGLADLERRGFITRNADGTVTGGKAKAAIDLMRQITQRTRDMLVRSGRLSQAQADLWERLSPNYVPMRDNPDAEFSWLQKFFWGSQGDEPAYTKSYKNTEFRHAMGRSTIADDPIHFAIQQWQNAVSRSMDNVARRVLADELRTSTKASDVGVVFWMPDERKKRELFAKVNGGTATVDEQREYDEMQNAYGALPMRRIIDGTGIVREVPDVQAIERDYPNIVAFKENGDLKFIRFGGFDVMDVTNNGKLSDSDANRIGAAVKKSYANDLWSGWGKIRKATAWFSMMRTAYSPTFVMTNFLADRMQGYRNIYADFGGEGMREFTKWQLKAFNAARMVITGQFDNSEEGRMAKEWFDNGGKIGGMATSTFTEIEKNFMRDLHDLEVKAKGFKSVKNLMTWLRSGSKTVENLNELVEMSTRIAAYATAKKMTGSVADAISYSRDITVNFNRKGEWTPIMNSLFAFSNASIQDLHRTGLSLVARHGMGMVLGTAILGWILSALGYGQDDPEEEKQGKEQYKFRREYMKQNQIGLRLGDHVWSVPLRGAMRLPFYLGAKIQEVMFGKSGIGEAAANVAKLAVDSATDVIGATESPLQSVTPSVARPFVEMAENKTFNGSKIWRDPMNERQVRSNMGRGNTGAVWKGVARAINAITGGNDGKRGMVDFQPEFYQHIVNSVAGSLGRDLGQAASFVTDVANTAIEGKNRMNVRNTPFLSRVASNLGENSAKYHEIENDYRAKLQEFNSLTKAEQEEYGNEVPFLSRRNRLWANDLSDLAKVTQRLMKEEMKETDVDKREALHQLRLRTQYLFIQRMQTNPKEDTAENRRYEKRSAAEADRVARRHKAEAERKAKMAKRGVPFMPR